MPKYIKMMEGFPWLVTSGIGRMNSFVVCFPKATNCHNKSVTNRQFVPETRSLVSENCSACSFLHVWGFDIINSWRLWRCWRRGLGGHNYNHQYHLPTTTHPPINHSPTTTEDLYQAPFCWFCFLLFLLEDQVLCQWNMSIHIDDMLFCWMCFFSTRLHQCWRETKSSISNLIMSPRFEKDTLSISIQFSRTWIWWFLKHKLTTNHWIIIDTVLLLYNHFSALTL